MLYLVIYIITLVNEITQSLILRLKEKNLVQQKEHFLLEQFLVS